MAGILTWNFWCGTCYYFCCLLYPHLSPAYRYYEHQNVPRLVSSRSSPLPSKSLQQSLAGYVSRYLLDKSIIDNMQKRWRKTIRIAVYLCKLQAKEGADKEDSYDIEGQACPSRKEKRMTVSVGVLYHSVFVLGRIL